MKRIISLIVFGLAMCGFAFAQSSLAELEKVKEIKFLKTTREDVKKILADYNLDATDDSRRVDKFSTTNTRIEITYSNGNCSDKWAKWNVPEWTVTEIKISPEIFIRYKDLSFDYSKFQKEKKFDNFPDEYIYHNKNLGIAVDVKENKIYEIVYFPSKYNYPSLCNKEEIRKGFIGKSIFAKRLKDRNILANYKPYYPDVVNLTLAQTEITADCSTPNEVFNKRNSEDTEQIAVFTKVFAKELEVFIYYYQVSGGKIIGKGANVIWDLSGVKSGTYTITANADNGCGLCGKTITKTVVIKERLDCSAK